MDLWGWMAQVVQQYGYAGAFLISIVGNFTVFLPVPYAITIYTFGATLDPLLLGLASGLGSTIGEFSAYLIGAGGRKVLEDKYGKRFDTAKLLVEKHGMMIIFIFALLPLPDDLILVPLGMMNYDLKKALAAAFLGKLGMSLMLAYAGRYSFSFIKNLFDSGGYIGGVVSTLLLIVIIVVMIKVDWTRFIDPELKTED
jgi:uncharacterized membrane protein YdjX (TVP38/TMEM64 family)